MQVTPRKCLQLAGVVGIGFGPLFKKRTRIVKQRDGLERPVHSPCRVSPASRRRELAAASPYSHPWRPVSMPVLFLVVRARPLTPLVRLGWGAFSAHCSGDRRLPRLGGGARWDGCQPQHAQEQVAEILAGVGLTEADAGCQGV